MITSDDLKRVEMDFQRQIEELRKEFLSAFPNQDLEHHKWIHQEFVATRQAKEALVKAVYEKVIVGVGWSLLLLIGSALWEYIQHLIASQPK